MSTIQSGNPIVDKISMLPLQGNLIPQNWYKHVQLEDKRGNRADMIAITILADIVYWYRATVLEDTTTGQQRARTKFHADKLQKSYDDWAETFCLTKRQVQEACARLVEQGLVTREARTIKARGKVYNNVLFWEPVVDRIQEITEVAEAVDNSASAREEAKFVSHQTAQAIPFKRETNTKTSTKTRSKDILSTRDTDTYKGPTPEKHGENDLQSRMEVQIKNLKELWQQRKSMLQMNLTRQQTERTRLAIERALSKMDYHDLELAFKNYAYCLESSNHRTSVQVPIWVFFEKNYMYFIGEGAPKRWEKTAQEAARDEQLQRGAAMFGLTNVHEYRLWLHEREQVVKNGCDGDDSSWAV
ncbi:MAG: hypothetical protein GX979_08525 [Firmicutes bacterium]|nr:hypothetical protein [Bacillota bacterium]